MFVITSTLVVDRDRDVLFIIYSSISCSWFFFIMLFMRFAFVLFECKIVWEIGPFVASVCGFVPSATRTWYNPWKSPKTVTCTWTIKLYSIKLVNYLDSKVIHILIKTEIITASYALTIFTIQYYQYILDSELSNGPCKSKYLSNDTLLPRLLY